MDENEPTLYDKAFAQEGDPIPRDHVVKVELIGPNGAVSESRDFKREDGAGELASYVDEYAVSMVAEGMAGTIRWGAAERGES